MDTLNSSPTETVMVPVEDLAGSVPGTSTPEASPSTGGLGSGESVPTSVPVQMTSTPVATAAQAAIAAPAATPAPVPVAAAKGELPKTNGQTVGGWNRFAGYNPNAAKNKPKDGRGGPGGRK